MNTFREVLINDDYLADHDQDDYDTEIFHDNEEGEDTVPALDDQGMVIFEFKSTFWWVNLTRNILDEGIDVSIKRLSQTKRNNLVPNLDADFLWWNPNYRLFANAKKILNFISEKRNEAG